MCGSCTCTYFMRTSYTGFTVHIDSHWCLWWMNNADYTSPCVVVGSIQLTIGHHQSTLHILEELLLKQWRWNLSFRTKKTRQKGLDWGQNIAGLGKSGLIDIAQGNEFDDFKLLQDVTFWSSFCTIHFASSRKAIN